MKARLFAVCAVALAVAAYQGAAGAAETGHGSMQGMHGGGSMEGHGEMMKGDKIFGGKVGPWAAEARLVDMKAAMEKSMPGMKMEGQMKTHHVEIFLTDPATKKPVEGVKGTVTVTGPGKTVSKADLMAMGAHIGADIDLPKPGKYTFKVNVESGGKTGTATFAHTIK